MIDCNPLITSIEHPKITPKKLFVKSNFKENAYVGCVWQTKNLET